MITLYERTGRSNLGHAFETAVLIELLRRDCEVHYLRTPNRHEVDFHTIDPEGRTQLIQVCADATDGATFDREIRSLVEAKVHHPDARAILMLLNPLPGRPETPDSIEEISAIPWFLESRVDF